MRGYRLHAASWARIVTQRVRRPESIGERLISRRRPGQAVPLDGRLVLIMCNHKVDPRTGEPVERRELLDRIIEALSIPEVDGVVASADLLEELTLLNVLEHRLAFCTASGDPSHGGVSASTIAASNFDGGALSEHWGPAGWLPAAKRWCVADDIAELAAYQLPAILDLHLRNEAGRAEFDMAWSDWVEPFHETMSAIATGAGVWISVPPIRGLAHLAEASGFPILIRDTDEPIDPHAWQGFFQEGLPLTIRGMVAGASALFPLEGSVAEATATIARSIRIQAIR